MSRQKYMPMKTKLRQLFIKMRKAGTSPLQAQPGSNPLSTSPAFTLRSSKNLLLNHFIDCYVENKLELLIISGQPNEQELKAHFYDLLTEYHDLIGSIQNKTILSYRKRLVKIREKIKQVIFCTHIYLVKRDPALKAILSKYNFRFESHLSDANVLKLLDSHVRNWNVDLEIVIKEIEQYNEKNKSDTKASRKTFLENIVAMKKEGFDIQLNSTMLDEYAVAVNAFNQLIEAKRKAAA